MSSEKLIAVAVGLMNQYQEYAKANGITQTDVASILAFLSQGEIQQQIKEEAENLVKNSVTVNITTKQIRDLLMQDVVAAYPEYARNNSLPDPANLGTYFLEYMHEWTYDSCGYQRGADAVFPGNGNLHEIHDDFFHRCDRKGD